MQLFYSPDIEDTLALPKDESRHCFNVLRKRSGDEIFVTDGNGKLFKCLVEDDNPKKNKLKIIAVEQKSYSKNIHLIFAPTKSMDRMEWLTEKAVELGVSEITFVLTSNCERRVLKLDRLQKKAISAMKQALRCVLPKINTLTPYQEIWNKAVQQSKYVAHLDDSALDISKIQNWNNVCFLIGPEGGFTNEEIKLAKDNDFQVISLGDQRLRAETAAVAVLSVANLTS